MKANLIRRFMASGGSSYLVPMLSRLMEGIRSQRDGILNVNAGLSHPILCDGVKGKEIVNSKL